MKCILGPESKMNRSMPICAYEGGGVVNQLVAINLDAQEYLPQYFDFDEAFSLHSKCNSNKTI